MKPYYQNNNVTVYNCNFMDIAETLSEDLLVVTDPPYNIGFRYDTHNDNMPDDDYIEMLSWLQKFRRVVIIQYPVETMRWVVPALGIPDEVVAWCYNSNIPKRLRLISFYGCRPDYGREKAPYKNPTDKRVKALIANGSKGRGLYEWWDDIQLVKNVSKEKSHPCPVPEALMRRIIRLTCDIDNDAVFDPFAGSLTTLKAARDLGLPSIGCEKSQRYIADGIKRFSCF